MECSFNNGDLSTVLKIIRHIIRDLRRQNLKSFTSYISKTTNISQSMKQSCSELSSEQNSPFILFLCGPLRE